MGTALAVMDMSTGMCKREERRRWGVAWARCRGRVAAVRVAAAAASRRERVRPQGQEARWCQAATPTRMTTPTRTTMVTTHTMALVIAIWRVVAAAITTTKHVARDLSRTMRAGGTGARRRMRMEAAVGMGTRMGTGTAMCMAASMGASMGKRMGTGMGRGAMES